MSLVTILPASLRRSITALLALGLVGVAGCNADTTGQGPVAPGEAPAAAHARPFGMKGRGPAGMLVEKAASLDLKPEQKATVEAIRARIQEPSPAVREAHDALHTGGRRCRGDHQREIRRGTQLRVHLVAEFQPGRGEQRIGIRGRHDAHGTRPCATIRSDQRPSMVT